MELGSNTIPSESFDLKGTIRLYTKKWKWFLLSILIFLVIGFIYVRYSQPYYSAEAKIQILEESGANPELSAFQDLGVLQGASGGGIEDEIQAFKSRSNLIEVVNQLNLNLKIEAIGSILSSELYKSKPFNINFMAPDSVIKNTRFSFIVDILTDTSFGYTVSEEVPMKTYSFGSSIKTPIGDVILTPKTNSIGRNVGKRFKVSLTPVSAVAQNYQNRIGISTFQNSSNILSIYLSDPIQEKAQDVINTLIDTYNKNAVLDKKAIADRTSQFIDDRIADIYADLSSVDQDAQDFKSGKGITDIASEASMNLSIGAANRQELEATTTQLNIAESMKDVINNNDGYEILPSNIGLSDGTIAETTAKYNELVLQRNRLLKSSGEKNPVVENLTQRLDGLKTSMKSSLNSVTNNLSMQANNLSSQLSRINYKIYSAPKNERALKDITREQGTIEALYVYLLQKREESQIAYASAAPKLKIIDRAFSYNSSPVSPNRKMIYIGMFALGLILPFSIIYVADLLDNKVHGKLDLEKMVGDIPVLAELPKIKKKDNKIINADDRSVLAEALRIFRTNLDYVLRSKKTDSKNNVIFVTSSISGEGKTFVSSNLSMIMASTNKKVLLIGADIRNPKLYAFFDSEKSDIDKLGRSGKNGSFGLTEYLYDDKLTTKDIISTLLVHNNTLDVIYSGKIPPNPAEMLMSDRVKDLLDEVSEMYDYVVVDTAPLMVVSDTLIISEYANQIIYVTRAGVTDKNVIEFPLKLASEGKLKGLSFIVNDVKETDLGYGGKYGYGYGKTLKKWWKF